MAISIAWATQIITVPRLDMLLVQASPEIREVQFGFIPDRLAPPDLRWRPCAADSLFDRQDIPLRGVPFLFPYTSHA